MARHRSIHHHVVVTFALSLLLISSISLLVSALPTSDKGRLESNPSFKVDRTFRYPAVNSWFNSFDQNTARRVFKMEMPFGSNRNDVLDKDQLIDRLALISSQWISQSLWRKTSTKRGMTMSKTGILSNDQRQRNNQTLVKRVATFGKRLSTVNSKFLSMTLDSDEVRWKFRGLNFTSKKLQNLASALAPANLRLGGTLADFLYFNASADESKLPYPVGEVWEKRYERLADVGGYIENFTMTGHQWWGFTNFTRLVGWDMMFDFNVFLVQSNGLWNTSNAKQLLDFSAAKNIPIPAFQLGNEPDLFYHYNVSIPGDRMAKNFEILHNLIQSYPLYKNSKIVGPDVTSVGRNLNARIFLSKFLKAGAYKSISAIGLHQYYMNGKTARLQDFLDPDVLDYMKTELDAAQSINHQYPPVVDLELTETSSCYGGGSEGLSGKYVAGFLWLDKLGVSAQYGVSAVTRQAFYGGAYSLLDENADPRPDYFLSVLFKRLVKGSVFHISVSPSTRCLRVYANCARTDFYSYPKGAVVVYYLNLCNTTESMTLNQFQYNDLELFQLTPGDGDGLMSSFVKLNGEKLELSGTNLPTMIGTPHKGDVVLTSHSFGFVAVPGAAEPLCGA